MTSLVFVTQLIDGDDPVLGFVVPQVRALARHVDRLFVIANEVRHVPDDFPADLVSLGKEAGAGRMLRMTRYAAALTRLGRQHRPDALLAHMCPIYLVAAAPVAAAFGMSRLLWFVHPSDRFVLTAAERLADTVLTAFPYSYPRQGPKITPIGHAIDTDLFSYIPVRRSGDALRVVAVGRTSAVKHYPSVIRGVALARARGASVQLTIVGPSITAGERRHREELEAAIAAERAADFVELRQGLRRPDVPQALYAADALINATAGGSADKVVFEAMAAGRPVVVSAPAFDPLLGGDADLLRFEESDVDGLADRLVRLAALDDDGLGAIGARLRGGVVASHSMDHWAAEVVRITLSLRGARVSAS